jgi:hypothetical protein
MISPDPDSNSVECGIEFYERCVNIRKGRGRGDFRFFNVWLWTSSIRAIVLPISSMSLFALCLPRQRQAKHQLECEERETQQS